MADAPRIIETVPIPDTFASGVGEVENIGHGMMRMYFYVKQGDERLLVAKIVMPACEARGKVARAAAKMLPNANWAQDRSHLGS